jgi:hypothetical protein
MRGASCLFHSEKTFFASCQYDLGTGTANREQFDYHRLVSRPAASAVVPSAFLRIPGQKNNDSGAMWIRIPASIGASRINTYLIADHWDDSRARRTRTLARDPLFHTSAYRQFHNERKAPRSVVAHA